jgi:hypothetical protein
MPAALALALGLIVNGAAWAQGGDRWCCAPAAPHFLQRLHPVGGWNPGGGLLHWWNPHCFPRCGGPDDYCRKPPPRVCWPPYPPWYTGAPPEPGYPCTYGPGACPKP